MAQGYGGGLRSRGQCGAGEWTTIMAPILLILLILLRSTPDL